ncbi:MAG: nucleoside monophosphate kinase [Elusimicrobiota bacterium]
MRLHSVVLGLALLLGAAPGEALVKIKLAPASLSSVQGIGQLGVLPGAGGSILSAPLLRQNLKFDSFLPNVLPQVKAPGISAPVKTQRTAKEALTVLSAKDSKRTESAKFSAVFDGVAPPVKLAIVGPPGSGKSTQAKLLAKDLGVVHISAGQLLREHARNHPAVAQRMNAGKLVDTDLVMGVVRERLSRPDVQRRGFILDGFPRRLVEEEALTEMLGREGAIDAMIRLDVPEAELLRRIQARGRADDSAEVFRERMKVYHEQTEPAIEKLGRSASVIRPRDAAGKVEAIYRDILSAVRGLFN